MANPPQELPKTYQPAQFEQIIYQNWEKKGYFTPKIEPDKKPFVISMPPPNATGILHLGHALFLSLQDIMIRYHRLKGDPTLWVPGTDHAAIATQNKVEKILAEEGTDRHALGREKFIERVKDFVAGSQDTIRSQIRAMGSSCDWTRERYTLDDGLTKAVQTMFLKMYTDRLIYRGFRLVNWCPRCASTLADDEVVYQEKEGTLWYIKYPLQSNPNKSITVATTRPETMLGDAAVAVHPDDDRYQDLVGQKVRLPLTDRLIPIIADKEIDQEFGTGAVKITPAHDPLDYEIGQRHQLTAYQVIGPDGLMTKTAGPDYAGLTTEECRKKVLVDLNKQDLIDKEETIQHRISRCYRCDSVVEPLLSNQWFVAVDQAPKSPDKKQSLKEKAIEVVENGEIEFVPDRFREVYLHWMENLHDWCISRQIWWGHQLPVYYCADCQPDPKKAPEVIPPDKKSISQKGVVVSLTKPGKCPDCGGTNIKRDPDTLDTWFSSGLWTFSTLGWPDLTSDLKYFHPTTVMETGYDIIFFWVARMILMTEYALDQTPFKYVYLHGLVRDKEGRKLSKSLGNVIDPIEMIDKYGADALRLSLVLGISPGNDSRIYEQKIAGFRNFANKLWNISRFILSTFERPKELKLPAPEDLDIFDRWLLTRFNQLIDSATQNIEKFDFSPAGQDLYDFIWHDLADWFLEAAKTSETSEVKAQILYLSLENLLKLLHPFTPFVTEAIWSYLEKPQELIISSWPKPLPDKLIDLESIDQFKKVRAVIIAIRNFKADQKIASNQQISINLEGDNDLITECKDNQLALEHLARAKFQFDQPLPGPQLKVEGLTISFEEIETKPEISAVDHKEIDQTKKYIAGLKKRLANESFLAKAPAPVVAAEKERLQKAEKKLADLQQ